MPTSPTPPNHDTPHRVWITYGGHRFHADPNCPALADGQAKARAAGHRPWQVVSTSPERARGRRACLICYAPRPTGAWSDTDDRILRTAAANGRTVAMIAGMLDRTEDQVRARLQTLTEGQAA
jgi:hypothetical protein